MKTINLKSGDKAPEFSAVDQDNQPISLKDFAGKDLILYFYPKDNTTGCTAEACSLRDGYEDLRQLGMEVVGLSPDSVKSHKAFISKYSLPFRLISDTDKVVANAYGVWGEKKMYGKSYMGILRTTFIINKQGIITHIFDKVDTKEHVKQILTELKKQ